MLKKLIRPTISIRLEENDGVKLIIYVIIFSFY